MEMYVPHIETPTALRLGITIFDRRRKERTLEIAAGWARSDRPLQSTKLLQPFHSPKRHLSGRSCGSTAVDARQANKLTAATKKTIIMSTDELFEGAIGIGAYWLDKFVGRNR